MKMSKYRSSISMMTCDDGGARGTKELITSVGKLSHIICEFSGRGLMILLLVIVYICVDV